MCMCTITCYWENPLMLWVHVLHNDFRIPPTCTSCTKHVESKLPGGKDL